MSREAWGVKALLPLLDSSHHVNAQPVPVGPGPEKGETEVQRLTAIRISMNPDARRPPASRLQDLPTAMYFLPTAR